jgi:hypothetical protein
MIDLRAERMGPHYRQAKFICNAVNFCDQIIASLTLAGTDNAKVNLFRRWAPMRQGDYKGVPGGGRRFRDTAPSADR